MADAVQEYISRFPPETRKALSRIRKAVRESAPDALETIGYGMPAYKGRKYIVFFAGFENHIGLYPLPAGMKAFSRELAGYKTGKGSVQFPLDKPMPLGLVKKIVKFRVKADRDGV